jgi:hypothetical protein
MVLGTKRQLQAAVTKAVKLGGARRVTYLGGWTYEIAGEHGSYRAYVRGENWRCGCEAGKNLRPCWHLGAVWLRRMGQESLVRGAKGLSA